MNFQDLKKIENADHYLDVAFRRASKRLNILRQTSKEKDKTKRYKDLEITRLEMIKASLSEDLRKILIAFPNIDDLDVFYKELIRCTLDYVSLKKSLGSLNWADKKVLSFFNIYKVKIKKCYEIPAMLKARKEYYGRISSIMKQINPYLSYLDESRRTMKDYPAIKTSVYTVCLFGFPNVGKSTLLSKITTASPEIKDYPFTTKKLNLGYIKEPGYNIQVIDTPGTLDRMDKMNNIELQAYLAIKHLASQIVYVFDPTYEYELGKQEKLFETIKESGKPIIIYLSKTDVADKKITDMFLEKYPEIITDANKIREILLKDCKINEKLLKDSKPVEIPKE